MVIAFNPMRSNFLLLFILVYIYYKMLLLLLGFVIMFLLGTYDLYETMILSMLRSSAQHNLISSPCSNI
jgi:hypothetical protein